MDINKKFSYQSGFASLVTTLATGLIVLSTMVVGAPTQADAPEIESFYVELAHRYDVEIPRKGLTDDDKRLLLQAHQVEQYYRSQKTEMPLAEYAYEMVEAADRYGLDYALLPAIARFETSGGRNLCQSKEGENNPFGFGSCKMAFDDFEHAFDHVAYSLSGQNPNTTVYAGKSNREILEIYNPPSVEGILPGYHRHILGAIDEIRSQSLPFE